jgi:hypothetical protein
MWISRGSFRPASGTAAGYVMGNGLNTQQQYTAPADDSRTGLACIDRSCLICHQRVVPICMCPTAVSIRTNTIPGLFSRTRPMLFFCRWMSLPCQSRAECGIAVFEPRDRSINRHSGLWVAHKVTNSTAGRVMEIAMRLETPQHSILLMVDQARALTRQPVGNVRGRANLRGRSPRSLHHRS